MTLRNEIRELRKRLPPAPHDRDQFCLCRGPDWLWALFHEEGAPEPSTACAQCGKPYRLRIVITVVPPRGEACESPL